MNFSSSPCSHFLAGPRLPGAVWLCLALAGASAFGQSPKEASAEAAALADHRLLQADCRVLFAVGDYDNGELVLLSRNHGQSGSAKWHIESASKLARMGLTMAAQGRTKAAEELTRRALLHLRQISPDTEPGLRANAEELAGFIHERLAGDAAKARQSYRNAVQLNPNSTRAVEALERLNRAADLAAQKPGRNPIGG